MLFFIDESWQESEDRSFKVGVLAAVQIKAHDFNKFSKDIFSLKVKNLGYAAGNSEIKGKQIFRDYLFRLETKGIVSNELNLARDIYTLLNSMGVRLFASIVIAKDEMSLSCIDGNLERPFFFLFERINLFMEENYPSHMAHIIFDDRGITDNSNIAKSVSNFFHKSHVGQAFDRIIKVPSFAISNNHVGIQMADMIANILGKRMVGKGKEVMEFDKLTKNLEFRSRKKYLVDGTEYPLFGFKTIKDKKKEAGDLFDLGKI